MDNVKNKQSLVYALVGDAVESLVLRKHFAITTDLNPNAITRVINKIVNAKAQAESFRLIEESLTSEEKDVAKRARNTHTHSTAKNYSVIDYRYATAFEAVLGYLYLNDRKERIDEILEVVLVGFQNGKIGSF
ncbi:MAG: ribonuclease III [Clostridia bacterium]|nr:ribonuclease III [Clostridia bacterium]